MIKQNTLPDGWKEVLTSDICDVRDGTHDSPKYMSSGVPLLTSKNIIENKLNYRNINYISETDAFQINKRSKVSKNDLLISMIGSIGDIALIKEEPNFCIKNVGLFKPFNKKIIPEYMFYQLSSTHYQSYIMSQLDGGIQRFISLGMLRKLKIQIPNSLEEQKRIAEILSSADESIDTISEKIDILKEQKKSLMQTLLTPKPHWTETRLGDVGVVITGNTPSKLDASNYGGEFCWATAEDLKGKYVYNTKIKLSEIGKEISRVLPKDSVLITCIASIGLNGIAKTELATNQQINSIIVSEKFNNEFVYYLIDNNSKVLKKYAGAGGLLMLSKSSFESIKLKFPSLPEQEEIADVLSSADEEVKLYEEKLEYLKEQKKSLMQKLLTGEWRV